jgi:hypothetical protein
MQSAHQHSQRSLGRKAKTKKYMSRGEDGERQTAENIKMEAKVDAGAAGDKKQHVRPHKSKGYPGEAD